MLEIKKSEPSSSDDRLIYQSIGSDYDRALGHFASIYNAIGVSVSKESIDRNRRSEDKIVLFEENNRGNYWLFDIGGDCYLVPTDRYINQHRYTVISTVFHCEFYAVNYRKIQVLKPAIVESDSNSGWQLQDRGHLVFR